MARDNDRRERIATAILAVLAVPDESDACRLGNRVLARRAIDLAEALMAELDKRAQEKRLEASR